MAKMKKKTGIKAKKKKKLWFKVLSPEVFGKKEIGEITAYDGKDLLGRTIELSSRDVGSRENAKKVVFKITKVQGETAETQVVRTFLLDNSVQRKSRKIKEKLENVFFVTLKSGEKMKFKIMLNTTSHISGPTKSALINALPGLVENELQKKTPSDILAAGYTTRLGQELKKNLKSIYPVSSVYVWKVSLV